MNLTIDTLPNDHVDVPQPLGRLEDLAYNTWWTWHREARQLFEKVDPDVWSRYRNPVRLLLVVKRSRLAELSRNQDFLAELDAVYGLFAQDIRPVERSEPPVAYVSAEYGLHESLPIYSGGLGVLSGDHLKEASDTATPLVAVGLFYRRGYFRQLVDADGYQQHDYPDLDAFRLPMLRVKGRNGKTLRVDVDLAGTNVNLRVWVTHVGRVPLLLLDAYTSRNPRAYRYLTSQLYVRGRELRLQQEALLGRGAVAVLRALDIRPGVYHMNEGHSAFLALENMRLCGSRDLAEAVERCRPMHVFTTHTAVPAGNEIFDTEDVRPLLEDTATALHCTSDDLLALGKAENGHAPGFNMTALSLRLSAHTNGVSKLHGKVSRDMWPEFEIGHVTNGVHLRTWIGPEMSRALGLHETNDPRALTERLKTLPCEMLWAAHRAQKQRLMRFVRVRMIRQGARHGQPPARLRRIEDLLNPEALTLGFARRFAAYKRADLLFHDTERLSALLHHAERPVQLIMAGKAHPADRPGQDIIRRIWELAGSEEMRGRIVFMENYDMSVARLMVRGVDVWMNTPEWPREACGTSGMKAVVNGCLHASTPDGWWAEAGSPDLGFVIGQPGAPERDRDACLLYEALEREIVPLYYDRDRSGLPARWIDRMRASMETFLTQFSSRRMLEEYAVQLYGRSEPWTVPSNQASPVGRSG